VEDIAPQGLQRSTVEVVITAAEALNLTRGLGHDLCEHDPRPLSATFSEVNTVVGRLANAGTSLGR
jgi:hypothetical protein